jgi:hypothetical protein
LMTQIHAGCYVSGGNLGEVGRKLSSPSP